MTILSVIQNSMTRLGFDKPTLAVGSPDNTVTQFLSLLGELGNELYQDNWDSLRKRVTFNPSGLEAVGTRTALFGAGWHTMVPETFWDNTLRRQIFGPLNDVQWSAWKSFIPGSPTYYYRIEGDTILAIPPIPANHNCSAVVTSRFWVRKADGTPYATFPTADNDITAYDEELLTLGLKWKFKAEKGLAYAQDLLSYNTMKDTELASHTINPRVSMGENSEGFTPGIWVPAGNIQL